MLLNPRDDLSLRHLLGGVSERMADVGCGRACGPPEPVVGHLGRPLRLNPVGRGHANAMRINHSAAKIARVRHKGGSGESSQQVPGARYKLLVKTYLMRNVISYKDVLG